MNVSITSPIVTRHRPEWCKRRGPLQFMLAEPLEVKVDGRRFRVPVGARTDGASTPRIFRSLVPRVGRHLYGAIFHDACYRVTLQIYFKSKDCWGQVNVSRKWADMAFLELMKATKTGVFTRTLAYWAVRLFGGSSYQGSKP